MACRISRTSHRAVALKNYAIASSSNQLQQLFLSHFLMNKFTNASSQHHEYSMKIIIKMRNFFGKEMHNP